MNKNVNENLKLGVIGCGKMTSAILGGIYKNKILENNNIYLYNRTAQKSKQLSEEYGFIFTNSIEELLLNTDVILLGVKPFAFNEIIAEIKKYYNNQLILSVLAGIKIEKYNNALDNAKIIRIMPNTPALISEGMSAICANQNVSNQDIKLATNIMSSCSKVITTTEDKIDIITALSGSGPAFYYKIIELMAKSAEKLGLTKDESLLLSAQTALGSAKMVQDNNYKIEQLIKNVTTPGGCTEVGNNVLANSNINEIFDKLIKDTMEKAKALG